MNNPSPGQSKSTSGFRNLRPLRHLWPYLRKYKGPMVGALAALTIAAVTVLGLGQGMRLLIDRGFSQRDAALLNGALVFMLGVVVVLAAASYARFYLVSWLGERVVTDMRRDVFAHVIKLSPAFFETTRTGEVISRLTNDITLLQTMVSSAVPTALRNILLVIGGGAMLLNSSPRLTALVVLVVPFVLMPILFFGRQVRRLSRISQDWLAQVSTRIEETISFIRTVQAYTQEKAEQNRFVQDVEKAFDVSIQRTRARALLTALVILLIFGAVAIVLWIGGHAVFQGRLTAGQLSSFVFYAIVVAGAIGALSEVMGDLQRASGAAERLLEILKTPALIQSPPHPVDLPVPSMGTLEFDHVTFSYPTRPEQAALEKISFQINPGESVALVGPSGSGKSTIFQLLLRFYDPQTGRILVDGVELRQADVPAVRSRIGLVSQDPVIFSTTALENIRYGRPEATDEEVRAAALAAHATEFLDRLPEGLNTYLGEKGVRLSGGQRQRLSMARAILKNPPILLLDEATSALDAESEKMVQEALEQLMINRTTLVIAHRLATIRRANRILVLDKGHLVATGTHAELLRQGGLYARLAALQFNLQQEIPYVL